MYNTCFWALVKAGRTPREANKELQVSGGFPTGVTSSFSSILRANRH